MLYGKKEHFDANHESFIPCVRGPPPEEKWMWFREMDHLIASAYNRVIVSRKHFFHFGVPHLKIQMIELLVFGWLSKSLYFVQVYLKPGCHIREWREQECKYISFEKNKRGGQKPYQTKLSLFLPNTLRRNLNSPREEQYKLCKEGFYRCWELARKMLR